MCVSQTWQEPRRTAPKFKAVTIEMGNSAYVKANISYVLQQRRIILGPVQKDRLRLREQKQRVESGPAIDQNRCKSRFRHREKDGVL